MSEVFIVAPWRTVIGSYGGVLSTVRPDDLLAHVMKEVVATSGVDASAIEEVFMGCANQAGEDNRNVARMSALLAGLPESVPGVTLNRLCGSGMDAVGSAARAIRSGELELAMAGGVESMSRAPFVMGKATSAFARQQTLEDTTIGWRFVNPAMAQGFGVDTMPQTAENVAEDYRISREDQDQFALWSQQKCAKAQAAGRFVREIVPLEIARKRQEPLQVAEDEHPRGNSTLAALAKLATPFRETGGTVTAGNASGVNDGACAMLLASAQAVLAHQLRPMAKVLGMATAGVAPRVMGVGPIEATRKVLAKLDLTLEQMDVIELNEAFAAQALACTRALGLADNDPRLNPNGGAIALGHPLGMSGARLVMTAAHQLQEIGGRYALCTMCIGVGQGIAMVIERV